MQNIFGVSNILLLLPAAVLAAAISWLANSYILPKLGNRGIEFVTPVAEELAKTGSALFLGAAILWTHTIFGLIEALVELYRRGAGGIAAAWLALAAHSLFGLITALVYSGYGFLTALLLASTAHIAWNWSVVYLSNFRKPRLD